MTGVKKSTANIPIQGTNYSAQQYDLVISYTGKVQITFGTQKIDAADIVFTTTMSNWFSEGVGMVKNATDGGTFEIKYSALAKVFLGDQAVDTKETFPGNYSQVKSFLIVK